MSVMERIDAVTRGFLGLTVACARCHNHKYDPISQKDYYALAGVFASTTYTEYPRVSEVQVNAWRQKQQAIDDLEEELEDFTRNESKQYAEILAHQTARYMVAAWRVSGKPKMKVDEAAEEDKLEPELLARWVKFLEACSIRIMPSWTIGGRWFRRAAPRSKPSCWRRTYKPWS